MHDTLAVVDSAQFVRTVGLVVLGSVRVVVLVNDTVLRDAMAQKEDAGAAGIDSEQFVRAAGLVVLH